jgi:hypothetical protein
MKTWNSHGQELFVGATGATGPGFQQYSGVTTAAAGGTTVTFPSPFPSILDGAQGDYVVELQGKNAQNQIVPVRYTRIPASMTLYPDFDATIVEWTASVRTQ